MGVPDGQHPVVQVLLVGAERVPALLGPPDDGQQEVQHRDEHHGERDDQRREQGDGGPRAEGGRVELAAGADDRAGHGEADEHRAGVAHEDPRRARSCAAGSRCRRRSAPRRCSGGWEADRSLPDSCSWRAEKMKMRERGDRGDPGEQAVQPVDEVHRVGQHDGEQHRQHACAWVWSRETRLPPVGPLPGSQSTCHCTPNSTSTRRPGSGRRAWRWRPGRTGRRCTPTRQISPPAASTPTISDDETNAPPRAGNCSAISTAAAKPGVDGHPAHPRDRQRVHVPVPDRRDRAEPDGEQPHDAGQQERHDDRGSEDQRVLAQSEVRSPPPRSG